MAIRIILFSAFLIFASCNSRTQSKTVSYKIDTTVLRTIKSNSSDTFIKNSEDTSRYLNLPYYDSSMYHPGSQGYVDTFTINNYKFRIIHQDTLFDGTVEKYKNGQWLRTMQFENLGNHNDYDISLDLDGDGFRDLIFYWKWYGEIHFFDPIKNEFCDTTNCTIGIDWILIDTSNRIFFENKFGKLMNSPVSSNLFTFKNATRIDIATLEILFNPNDDNQDIVVGKLYHNKGKALLEKIIPKSKTSVTDFDYEKFRKERYKKLIGSR